MQEVSYCTKVNLTSTDKTDGTDGTAYTVWHKNYIRANCITTKIVKLKTRRETVKIMQPGVIL